jgi:hypothetical protein
VISAACFDPVPLIPMATISEPRTSVTPSSIFLFHSQNG